MELLFGHFKRRINEQLLTWMSGKLFNLPSPFYFFIIIIIFFFQLERNWGLCKSLALMNSWTGFALKSLINVSFNYYLLYCRYFVI